MGKVSTIFVFVIEYSALHVSVSTLYFRLLGRF